MDFFIFYHKLYLAVWFVDMIFTDLRLMCKHRNDSGKDIDHKSSLHDKIIDYQDLSDLLFGISDIFEVSMNH